MSQHIVAPAVPTVQKGDHVKAGQKIAAAGGFVSAPVYASVSGTVKGIEKKVSAAGSPVDCIAVENEYGNTPAQRAELDWLLYNTPLEYTQMVLRGEMEHYLSLGCDHSRLED